MRILIYILLSFTICQGQKTGPTNVGLIDVMTLSSDVALAASWGDISGFSASVDVKDGDNIKLSISFAINVGSNINYFRFVRGSTALVEAQHYMHSAADPTNIFMTWTDEDPGAGTYTYKVQAYKSAGSPAIQGAGTNEHPIFLIERR